MKQMILRKTELTNMIFFAIKRPNSFCERQSFDFKFFNQDSLFLMTNKPSANNFAGYLTWLSSIECFSVYYETRNIFRRGIEIIK